MRILALDFGTKTGFCYGSEPANLQCGTWLLGTPKEIKGWGLARRTRTRDPRIKRLSEKLRQFPLADCVVFEDVQFASSTYQVQLWASLRTVAWLEYPDTTAFECVSVGSLKKFASGSGNADKTAMRRAAERSELFAHVDLSSCDDNAIDAAWIFFWAFKNLARRA